MDPFTPFSVAEHSAFLHALEKYGEGTSGHEWTLISDEIKTRSQQEVMLHAHQYFLRLQASEHSDNAAAAIDDGSWTFEEETVFENGLATFDEADADRWAKIASLLPEKSAEDVQRRYQKLLYDVTRIEAGSEVALEYKVKKGLGAPVSTVSAVPEHAPKRVKNNGAAAAAALAAVVQSAMDLEAGEDQEEEDGQNDNASAGDDNTAEAVANEVETFGQHAESSDPSYPTQPDSGQTAVGT